MFIFSILLIIQHLVIGIKNALSYNTNKNILEVIMKKILFIILFIFLINPCNTTNAQVKFAGIGACLGTNFFIGDSPIEFSSLSPNLGIYSIYDLAPNFSLKFQIGYSKLIIETTQKQIQTSSLPIELSGLFKSKNSQNFTPLLQLGLGVMSFSTNGSSTFFDGLFTGGVGFESQINDRFSFLILSNLTYTTGDDFNGHNNGLKDGYFSFQTGLTYNPNSQKYEKKSINQKNNIIAQNNDENDSTYFNNLQLNTQITNLATELEKKNMEIEELKSQLENTNQKLASFENKLNNSKTVNLVEKKNSNDQNRNNKTVKEIYNEALRLYDSKNYENAIDKFNNLFKSNPSHSLASNYIYWIGESYWGLNDYQKAIEAFEKVKNYSSSNKIDDALLMVGLSYMKLGDHFNAKINFTELLERFPESEFINKAKHYLDTINNKIIS
jgi:tol-pal system protein YbgF